MKSALSTRPICHKCDETIRGHVRFEFTQMLKDTEMKISMNSKGSWMDGVMIDRLLPKAGDPVKIAA